jgi:uncharacterized protein YbjT (DUF2867 family)
MEKKKILVIGATGAQGGSVARALLNNGNYHVCCFTRNAASEKAAVWRNAGAEVAEGCLEDMNSLTKAIEGCYGVFGITNFWEHFDKEFDLGKNLTDAAHQSNIQHFVFSTLPSYRKVSKGDFSVPQFDNKAELEEYAKSLGLKATYVHIASYYENFFTYFRPQKGEDGHFHFGFPQGDTPMAMVSVADFGYVVAAIFNHPAQYIGRTLEVLAEEETCTTYADAISGVLGEKVVYDYIPHAVFASFPFPGAELLAHMFEVQRRFVLPNKKDKQECYLLHPQMQRFEAWLQANKEAFAYMKEKTTALQD